MNTGNLMYEWNTTPWRKLEVQVFKLQKRIYRASERGDVQKARKLQRLLIKSRAAKLLAVRKVTQDNRGKRTAGIDGVKNLSPANRIKLASKLELPKKAQPIRRVYIPKPGKKEKRPLGIPTMQDRASQALVKLALEPEWEAKFEAHSYGFRPGRSTHDAVKYIFNCINRTDKYVLDADINKCFDKINHRALLDKINTFPTMRKAIKAWLKSGVMEGNKIFPTREGTPQGVNLSPLLANIALHGLEEYVKSHFPTKKKVGNKKDVTWKPLIVRYADDFLIMHRDLEELKRAKAYANKWLSEMGLEFNQSKTKIVHSYREFNNQEPGFEFLGFSFKQYKLGKKNRRTVAGQHYRRDAEFKTIITPTKEAIKRHKAKLSKITDSSKTATQEKLINALNPVITGWGNYYARVNSSEAFSDLDHWLFIKLRRWAIRRHPMKSMNWIVNKYWHVDYKYKWDFSVGDLSLKEHRKIAIKMHVGVKENLSPLDGDWVYWSTRKRELPGTRPVLKNLLYTQKGKCQECNLYFKQEDIIEVHHIDGNHSNRRYNNLAALQGHCHDHKHRGTIASQHSEEPYEVKVSRTVRKPSTNSDVSA